MSGLKLGFDTGVSAQYLASFESKNLLSARKDPNKVSDIIADELQKGYLIGPFHTPPFQPYRVSPAGLSEHKYSGKKRLIVSPHDNPEHPSINDLIPQDQYSLSYVTIDHAIHIIQKLGQGSWLCKCDIKEAFKQLPIHPKLWHLHGIKWQDQYYFFTRLVFGSRSSPKIFDTLSQAIVWIAQNNFGIDHILHLLDDFLTIARPEAEPMRNMALLSMLFNQLGIPLAEHKTVGPCHKLEYLGIILDTQAMEARLPLDKMARITSQLETFLGKNSCRKRDLLSLIGHLVFASRVVVPGRSFMSRLFVAANAARELHHHVTLTAACKADLHMWSHLLRKWNGISMFLEQEVTLANDLHLYTDASSTIGFGGYYQGQWFYGAWPEKVLSAVSDDLSIAFKELYPIVVAAILWGEHWSKKRIQFHCDNLPTVQILNKGRSPCPLIMKLLRRLVITATIHSFTYLAKHIPGATNLIADSLSRHQFQKFRKLAPEAAPQPCTLPANVMFG